jgi:sugar lactone lactonase YvrE
MKPLTSRGGRPRWLYVFGLFLAVLGGFSPQRARAQVYPKEYIRVQPLSVIVQEGGAVVLDLEYAFGQDARDQTEVYWYRNGKLIGVSLPVLQTYVTPAGAFPKLWDPYVPPRGRMYENAADVATANLSDARAVWLATFNIPTVSAKEAGMYYAKVGAVGTFYNWTYTNFAQVAMVPKDPSQSMEIVRNPLSKSLSAPNSNPVPAIKLYGDMRSHVSPILHTPFGTATDSEGFTFIADTLNHCIRKVSPGGRVTTLAGMDGQPYTYVEPSQYDPLKRDARTRKERDPVPGFRAGVTNQALIPGDATAYRFLSTFDPTNQNEPLFKGPEGIAISDLGIVYVADTGNNAIRGIRTVGNVTTVFDLYGNPGSSNLKSPRGVFFSGSSSDPVNNPPVLFVLDSANYSVKKLYLNELDGSLDTSKGDPEPFPTFPNERTGCEKIAGLGQTPGWQGVPVSAADAKFYSPRGLIYTTDPATGSETIYIADTVNHVIRQLTKTNNAWTARTVVGFVGAKGNVSAVGTAARLNYPVGLALDEVNQLLYFTEFGNHSLRRVNLPYNSRNITSWTVDRVAGSGFYGPTLFGPNGQQGTGNGDGLGTAAVFYYPAGIAFNKTDGSILLADTNNNVLRKISIATTGDNAWIGDSTAFAGSVGVAGNRDFSDLPEFTYRWKKDALLLTDNAPAAVSSISGSRTDTLAITDIQYEDAGVYALVVTNAFEEVVETAQSFVYVATAGDQPKFLSPGYRVESRMAPGIPLVDLQQGADIDISADILPSDQVTYQWEVTEDVPDANGDYDWIALTDLPIAIQTLNNPKDVDTVRNAQRIRLGTLLGTNTTTISGATAPKLAIGKLQASLTSNVPPKLRFRVQAYTKAVPALPLDTKVDTTTLGATWTVSPAQTVTVNDATGLSVGMTVNGAGITPGTKIKAINGPVLTLDTPASSDGLPNTSLSATLGAPPIVLSGTWTAVPEQTVTVDTADGLSVGMYLVGPGIAPESKIKAIDTSNPLAIVLTLDSPVLLPGTNVQISGAVDFIAGTGLSIRYPVIVTNPKLSLQLNAGPQIQLANAETVKVANNASITLRLSAGTSAALGNPSPAYQWYKKDSVSGTPVAINGATQTTYSIPSIQVSDRGYYFVTISNGVGASADSDSVFIDVERPPSLTILSMSLDGGSLTQNVVSRQKRVVDKTKSPALSLTANVDASVQPEYTWTFQPDDPSSPAADISKVGVSVRDNQRTYGQFSIANISDDADGVFTLTITVPANAVPRLP